jgi:hypothetical protein
MTPAVSFSNLSIGIRPVAATGQLAELSKRQQALTQKLAEASKATPPPPSTVAADSIAREISGVQAQIEQIMLEAQLSKLNATASPAASAGEDSGTNASGKASAGSPGSPGPAASPDGANQGPDYSAAARAAPSDPTAKDERAGRPGTNNTGPASSAGHGPAPSRLSAAAAAQYGLGATPTSHLDLRV